MSRLTSALNILHNCSKTNLLQHNCHYFSGCINASRHPIWSSFKLAKSSFHSLTSRHVTSVQMPIFNKQQKKHVKQTLLCGELSQITHPSITFTRGFKVEISDAAVSNIYIPTPVETCYELLENFHDMYGLPWWFTIVASTFALRFAVIMPLAIMQQRVMAKIENVQIEINTYAEQLKQKTAVTAKENGWSQRKMANVYSNQISKFVRNVHMRENCRPMRMTYVSIAQAFIWVTMTTAIGQMTGVHPYIFGTEVDIDFLPALMTEGVLWFKNLVQPDFILPFLLGASNISLVMLWSLRRGPLSRTQHRSQFSLFAISAGLVPAAVTMPTAVTLYWTVSSMCGLAQFFILRIPSVRRLLYIPLSSSEMKRPLQEMLQIFKIRYQSKKYF
ncbi:cytochrome c oxidase assembly protein COX18, mitochondrial-like [Anneissia japonica]|uniref:cytochrome c oxidase assembly protein COX18, mitochondrial-like n=1 Tax=Anneissia japonica TaxID=1529436 RepID=UPI001425AB69|nr:cytochrome c oxidase assembly protein COX18, mitochondrial-like [Anneissia japonica]